MPREIHRTAVFTLPRPTQPARAVLERAFRDYAHAYGTLLRVLWLRFGQQDDLTAGRTSGLSQLRWLATSRIDEKTGIPHLSYQKLTNGILQMSTLPPQAREALDRLPGRLRQSARENVAQSLVSYVALADAWIASKSGGRGGPPEFPSRMRPLDERTHRIATLEALAMLADDARHERRLVAQLLSTHESSLPAIPFVGAADEYGCGLYYCAETASYYVRLDISSPGAHGARPLSMYGVYTQIKSGERLASETHLVRLRASGVSTADIHSFGKAKGRLWLPIKLDETSGKADKCESYHQRELRFTHTAFLPKPGSGIMAAEPVAAKLVRRDTYGHIWYELHMFGCVSCSTQRDVDELAAVNIGRKLLWLRVRGEEKRAGKAEDERSSWEAWLMSLYASK